MKKFVFLCFISSLLFAKTYVLDIKEKGEKYLSYVEITKLKAGGLYLKNTVTKEDLKDMVVESKLNNKLETVEWRYKSKKSELDVVAVREGDKIIVTGKFDCKENNRKELGIDSRPWYQIFQIGVSSFAIAGSGDNSIEFWGLRPDSPGSSGVLAATRDKTETIEVNGKKVEACKLRIGLAGWLSIFWTGDFWFRKTDGVYIKASPGGDSSVELIEEKD